MYSLLSSLISSSLLPLAPFPLASLARFSDFYLCLFLISIVFSLPCLHCLPGLSLFLSPLTWIRSCVFVFFRAHAVTRRGRRGAVRRESARPLIIARGPDQRRRCPLIVILVLVVDRSPPASNSRFHIRENSCTNAFLPSASPRTIATTPYLFPFFVEISLSPFPSSSSSNNVSLSYFPSF